MRMGALGLAIGTVVVLGCGQRADLPAPDSTAGTIVVEQLPGSPCDVLLDGRPWPGTFAIGARVSVLPGPHVVECRSAAGGLFERQLVVETGRETPVYWGP